MKLEFGEGKLESWQWAKGRGERESRCWMLPARLRQSGGVAGCWMLVTGLLVVRMLVTGYWLLETGCRTETAYCQLLLVTGYWLLVNLEIGY